MFGELMNAVDLPGSMVRDMATWIPGGTPASNPFDQLMTPFSDENRTSGRQLLRDHGAIGQDDTWANWLSSAALEAGMDPFTYLTLGLGGAMKSGGMAAAKGLGKAGSVAGRVVPNSIKDMAGSAYGTAANAMGKAGDMAGSAVDTAVDGARNMFTRLPANAQMSISRGMTSPSSMLQRGMDTASGYARSPGMQRGAAGLGAAYNAMHGPEHDIDSEGPDDVDMNPYTAQSAQPGYQEMLQEHDMFSKRRKAVDAMKSFMAHVEKQRSAMPENQGDVRSHLLGMVGRDLSQY